VQDRRRKHSPPKLSMPLRQPFVKSESRMAALWMSCPLRQDLPSTTWLRRPHGGAGSPRLLRTQEAFGVDCLVANDDADCEPVLHRCCSLTGTALRLKRSARQRCGSQSLASKRSVERRLSYCIGQLFGCVRRITDACNQVGYTNFVVSAPILELGNWERVDFLKVA
jgi:hypothetical protein